MENKWLRFRTPSLVTLVHVEAGKVVGEWLVATGGSPLTKRFLGKDVQVLKEWLERGFGPVEVTDMRSGCKE